MTRRVPHRWGYIALGTAAVMLGGVVCVLFLASASGHTPHDLVSDTRAELDRMEKVLHENAIPTSNITRGSESIRQDGKASWAFTSYTVEIPGDMNVEGVTNVLRKRLRRGSVTVANNPGHELVLAMDNRPFAHVRVAHGEPAPDPVAHYGPAGERAVDDVVRALRRALPTMPVEKRSIPTPRSNHEAVWSYITVDIELPTPYDPLLTATALAALPADVSTGTTASELPNTTVVAVFYKGLPCGEVLLSHDAGTRVPKVPHILRLATAALNAIPPTIVGDSISPNIRLLTAPRKPRPTGAPRMAIIVDDGGYYAEATDRILALDTGLTLSILPFAPLSEYTARRGAELGFEIMLHMPMASFNSIHNAPGYIDPQMMPDEIVARLDAALAAVPTAIGLNNHTGSKFTSDEPAMETLLTAVKSRSLYFIDSRTTARSRALEVALRMQVPTVPRDLFLDNSKSQNSIRARFEELIAMSVEHGTAVGICHFRPNTAIVMEEVLPEIRNRGIEIVHVSELLP